MLVAAKARMFKLLLSQAILVWLIHKRIRHTRFAGLDTTVYSPLCLALAIGSIIVGFSEQA